MHRPCYLLFALTTPFLPTFAQCHAAWGSNGPLSSTTARVLEVTRWDPDGSGPVPPRLVAAWGQSPGGGGVLVFDDQTSSWQPLGASMDNLVSCVLATTDGGLFAGGSFQTVGGVTVHGVARWDGAAWTALGSGVANPSWPGTVSTLEQLPDGSVLAGGSFSIAGGVAASCVARWDGTQWSAMGDGTNGTVAASCVLPGGDVVIGGSFSASGATVVARVARWDGVHWVAVGAGVGAHVDDLEVTADGSGMVAASANGVHRWDGSTWTPLPPTIVYAKAVLPLPDGDVLVAGIGGGVHRWDGVVWQSTGFTPFGITDDLFWVGDGTALALGDYATAQGVPLAGVQVLATDCVASVATGGGCGSAALVADTAPWTGAPFTTHADGLTQGSLLLVVRGLSPASVALAGILPQGLVGCELLVQPEVVDIVIPAGGSASASLLVPNAASLAGLVVHEQWLVLELGAAGITSLGATNALIATIGSF